MTIQTDLSSSLSGAMDDLLSALRTKAPDPYVVVAAGKTEWFYDIVKKSMVRVLAGTRLHEVPEYPEDKEGRVVVQTANGDIIRIAKEHVETIGFH